MADLRRIKNYEGIQTAIKGGAELLQQIGSIVTASSIIFFTWLTFMVALQLQRVPDLAFLQHYHPVNSIEIYDRDDKLVCVINKEENHKLVPLDQIAKPMQEAVLTAEDRRFYQHHGLSLSGMFRATFANLHAGHVVEGGSTITQQLAKNLFFFQGERTLVRKVAEAIVAAQIESRYSKDQILCMYLNQIYFGNGAHGVEQASLRYFAKHAAQLNVPESAFLAGLIRAPSVLGTAQHRSEAIVRQREIINDMVELGYIQESEAQNYGALACHLRPAEKPDKRHPFEIYPYYVSHVMELINQRYDDNLIRQGGLRVYTNLDQTAQKAAEAVLARQIRWAPRGIDQEALVSISISDGAVRAIVGGAGDYWSSQWNCATTPHTVGSAFKPFVYLAAFIKDVVGPESFIDDAPLTVNQIDMAYSPKNYDGQFLGKIIVAEALAKSRNTCAVRIAQMVGTDAIVDVARLSGIETALDHNLSIALGSCAVSPLQMAGAYGTLARGGVRIDPWVIRRIEDLHGDILESAQPPQCRVLPEEPVAKLVGVLADVVSSGTGTQARLGNRPVAGKTGTSDQSKDLWFIGFTPDMVTAVWGGSMANKPIKDKHATGGSVIARVWRDFNATYYTLCPTPAGVLIATGYSDEKQDKPAPPVPQADEEPAQAQPARAYVYPSQLSAPTNGAILTKRAGVTEYGWVR